ncbi:hypothetical protein ACFQE8_08755 [Salinirubellus sp. GCM10025818]|uniref:DUF7470 family protein n=1 Tax=Salinirubellus TaxID=2162630 RepID=UPI0030D35154
MDLQETRELLGGRGQVGAALVVLGVLVVGRENRVAAAGAVLILAGVGLVAGGLVDTALEKTGMKGAL